MSLLVLASVATAPADPGVTEWASSVSKLADPAAIEWAETTSTNTLAKEDYSWLLRSGGYTPPTPCSLGASDEPFAEHQQDQLLVCVSFSMPDSLWLSLSPELQELGGAFVLRGLPEGGFPALAANIRRLSDVGVSPPILIDPALFQEYDVQVVPTYVIKGSGTVDRVAGTLSPTLANDLLRRGKGTGASGTPSSASSFHFPPQQSGGGE
ncbi:MAG: type-F conjugative transfer system pilin assembly protein TrbC [Candidatus Obscuribacterales bacterium]